jgi:AcrR family transcriptional regulator
MSDEKRPYRMKRRAELEAQTRRRITESAVALHGSVGPARTTISAVAEHAGVRRSTVYRHFPDEEALFTACSSHWRAANPPPDLGRWAAVADPDERLELALSELYAFYRRTERMMENILRDEPLVPVLTTSLDNGYRRFLTAARETLIAGRRARGRKRREAEAAIGHALTFSTWKSLAGEQGLEDDKAAELMCRFVSALL